jgi:hypothetical protein
VHRVSPEHQPSGEVLQASTHMSFTSAVCVLTLVCRHAQAIRERVSLRLPPPLIEAAIPPVDTIAELADVRRVILEWFELYHPACPIMHRATLLTRLDRGDAQVDAGFFCFVVAVVCSTIGNLRHAGQSRYPEITLGKCEDALELAGFHNLRYASMTLERCITLYHMSYSHYFYAGMDDSICFKYMQEATSIMRYIISYDLPQMTDLMEIQLTKRTFWLLFGFNW